MPVEGEPEYAIAASDDFDSGTLMLQWQWQGNPDASAYSLSERPGWLTLSCLSNSERDNLLWYSPHALTQIPQSSSFTATVLAELDGREEGDLCALGFIGHQYGYTALCRTSGGFALCSYRGRVIVPTFRGEAEERLVESVPLSSGRIFLRMELRRDMNVIFSYSEDGEHYSTVKHVFPVERATWTGAKIALWAANRDNRKSQGRGHFDFIRFS